MSIGPEDAESLIHAMVVDQEKALWQALPETIRQSLQNHLREAIKRWAEECGNNEKALLLEICKICRVCDQSLMPFKIEEKVRIEGKTVEYRGIEYYEDEQGDVIQLRYSDSERKIPIRCIDIDIDIDKLSKERDDAPLSKQESKRRTTKKG